MSKKQTMNNSKKRKHEMGSALNSMKTENMTDTPIFLALNMSKVVNNSKKILSALPLHNAVLPSPSIP
jgi:hypothetical protein